MCYIFGERRLSKEENVMRGVINEDIECTSRKLQAVQKEGLRDEKDEQDFSCGAVDLWAYSRLVFCGC
jgi:hypothetical protein